MSGEVGRKHWGPGMTGADVLRAALHLALRPGPRCRSGRVGPADQIDDAHPRWNASCRGTRIRQAAYRFP